LRRPVGKGSICSPFYWVAFIRPHIQAPDLNQHNNKLANKRKPSAASHHPQRCILVLVKPGFISFGGPAGQNALMHTDLVEKCRWISEHRFLHALNYCMLLPGPEATQLATYIC
jgi:hypothetical protein